MQNITICIRKFDKVVMGKEQKTPPREKGQMHQKSTIVVMFCLDKEYIR